MSALNEKHPSKFTPEEKAALQASDPEAFDIPVAGDGTTPADPPPDDPPAGDPPADPPPQDPPADPEEDPPADPPPADPATPPAVVTPPARQQGEDHIPKARFDEVNVRAKEATARAEREAAARQQAERERDEMRRKLEERDRPPPRNFDAELKEVKRRYDDDNDLSLEERDALIEKIIEERGEAKGAAKAVQQVQEKTQEEQWNAAVDAFMADPTSKVIVDDQVRLDAFNAAIAREYRAADGKLPYPEVISRAREAVSKSFNLPPPADPHAARKRADAEAAARASGQPPAMAGGVGGRGGPQQIDVKQLKPGDFSKLPKDKQEELLGGAGMAD